MHAAPHPKDNPVGRFAGPAGAVFDAAIETVRGLPGWEVLAAHPEEGEIIARSKGRIFTPTREHVLHLRDTPEGTDISMESRHARTHAIEEDPRTLELFRALLEDRLSGVRR